MWSWARAIGTRILSQRRCPKTKPSRKGTASNTWERQVLCLTVSSWQILTFLHMNTLSTCQRKMPADSWSNMESFLTTDTVWRSGAGDVRLKWSSKSKAGAVLLAGSVRCGHASKMLIWFGHLLLPTIKDRVWETSLPTKVSWDRLIHWVWKCRLIRQLMLPGQKTSPIRRKWSASSTTIAGIESFWPSVSTSTLRSIASPRRSSSATLLVLGQLDVQTALGCTGRTLVLEGRQSKQWTCQPLPPKISYGKRGMGPETISEARPESSCHSVANSINSVARRWRCKSLACRRGSACDLRSSQSSKEGVHSSKCCL